MDGLGPQALQTVFPRVRLELPPGKSDKVGAYVESNPVRPEELAATIYHALDIPLNEPQNNSGFDRPLTTGKPVMELFG